MDGLSPEILVMIFNKIDRPTLLECRRIATRFAMLIDDPEFYKHLPLNTKGVLKPMPLDGFCAYMLWYLKYIKYCNLCWRIWPVVNDNVGVFTIPRTLSLMQLNMRLEILHLSTPSFTDYLLAVKALIIGFDAPNLVSRTHNLGIKSSEIYRVIYGRIKLFLMNHENDENVLAYAKFKEDFCDKSAILERFSLI
jgi:hypothetical protein